MEGCSNTHVLPGLRALIMDIDIVAVKLLLDVEWLEIVNVLTGFVALSKHNMGYL